MRFLLDQGLPRSTVAHLASVGLDSEHVGDLGLALASDQTILEEGRRRNAIVVTLDSDFHTLLAQSNSASPSVVRIRIQGLTGTDIARVLHSVVEAVDEDLMAGAAVTVTDRRLGVRRLPIHGHDNDNDNDPSTGSAEN